MENSNFTDKLVAAVDTKTKFFDESVLPQVLEDYRLLHSCVKNITDFLLKKSIITPDPYKKDKKISDIIPPENTPFTDAERSVILGTRISDYDSTLDFLCNYYKFSVSHLTLPNIRKLIDLNSAILWNSFSVNSQNFNTRVLATVLTGAKQKTEALTLNQINDSVSKAGKAILSINKVLKELTDFQREVYKCSIRVGIYNNPGFDSKKAVESSANELAQIKKLFTPVMGKMAFYSELIDEIINENHSPNKEQLQNALLEKLAVTANNNNKKEEKINTKELILTSLRVFGAMPGQILQAKEKLMENHNTLESEHNSFMDKLKKLLRKAFNLEEKPVFYTIIITDSATDTRHSEKVNFNQFISELDLRARKLNSVGIRKGVAYERFAQSPEEKILEYVNQQISESQTLLKLLNGFDDFFKREASPENKNKIKGLQMEITSLKNSVIKANQHRSEYTSYIEEEAQLRKLGITNE